MARTTAKKATSKKTRKTTKTRARKAKEVNFCIRCHKTFSTRNELKRHSKTHLADMKEMKMLEKGYVPEHSKIGQEFKGKNKIVIA